MISLFRPVCSAPENLKGAQPVHPQEATLQRTLQRKHKAPPIWVRFGRVSTYVFENLGDFSGGFE